MMKSFFPLAFLLGGLCLASCSTSGDDPQMPPQPTPTPMPQPLPSPEPEQPEGLILRIPEGVDASGVSYELEGKELWLDKNLNGQQDAGEAVAGGGVLNLPANASGETVYHFYGPITGLTLFQPAGSEDGDAEEEDEEEGEDAEGSEAEGAATGDEARALALPAAAVKAVTLDASHAKSLLSIEWSASLPLGAVDLRGAKELRLAELGANPIQTLVLPEVSNLRVLKLRDHQLQRLDLTKQTHLQQLLLVRGALRELTLGTHEELKQLSLSGNALETLTLPYLPALTLLSLEKNKLHTLQLSTNKSFDYLETCQLSDNQLSQLDLSPLVRTKLIDVSRNPLTRLQLPRDLKELRVASTKLAQLHLNPTEVGARSFIQKLDASDCAELTDLQASQCTNLAEVMLAHCPKLTPARLLSALPQLSAAGKLYYEQPLSAEQRARLTTLGWSVLP